MIRNIGAPEIIILGVLIILIFGWKRLPDAARSLGRSARVFKSEVQEMREDGHKDETVRGETVDDERGSRGPDDHAPGSGTSSDSSTSSSSPTGASSTSREHRDEPHRSAVQEDSPRTDNQSGPIR